MLYVEHSRLSVPSICYRRTLRSVLNLLRLLSWQVLLVRSHSTHCFNFPQPRPSCSRHSSVSAKASKVQWRRQRQCWPFQWSACSTVNVVSSNDIICTEGRTTRCKAAGPQHAWARLIASQAFAHCQPLRAMCFLTHCALEDTFLLLSCQICG